MLSGTTTPGVTSDAGNRQKSNKYANMTLEQKSQAVQNSFVRSRLKETEKKAELQILRSQMNN